MLIKSFPKYIHIKILFLSCIFLLCLPVNAHAECKSHDMTYKSGDYLLTFYTWEERKHSDMLMSATVEPFRITHQTENLVFDGIVMWSNGFSMPHVTIDLCAGNHEEYEKGHHYCTYKGVVYTLDGLNTTTGFSRDGHQNPILFSELAVRYNYSRAHLPKQYRTVSVFKDVWENLGCEE